MDKASGCTRQVVPGMNEQMKSIEECPARSAADRKIAALSKAVVFW